MRNTSTQDERRWDAFFAANKALMTTGWRMDAYSLRASRSYPCFNGNGSWNTQVRVGQANDDGSHPTLASVGWAGAWTDIGGGANGTATMRSDGSLWFAGNSGILSKSGVDGLKDIQLKMEVVDDGSKSGGV